MAGKVLYTKFCSPLNLQLLIKFAQTIQKIKKEIGKDKCLISGWFANTLLINTSLLDEYHIFIISDYF